MLINKEIKMNNILEFTDVSKKFSNGVYGLKNVSFSVKPGEFISVIGPSGSGKSTLLRSINKFVTVTSGKVCVDNELLNPKKGRALRETRRKIGMVFQNYNLIYNLSVIQNVLHGCLGRMKGLRGILGLYSEEDKLTAIELLREMGLEEQYCNRASELSGGQKQRAGIARAIIQDPKLLLCDEPIASLDPSSAKTVMDILFEMTQKRNIACIVNLHQVDVAMRYSTRIIGLKKGEIIFDGSPDELTSSYIENIYGTSMENLVTGVKNEKEYQVDAC